MADTQRSRETIRADFFDGASDLPSVATNAMFDSGRASGNDTASWSVRPLCILHLEDDPADVRIVRDKLDAEGVPARITVVDTREALESALDGGGFDLVLADYNVPGFNGLQALEAVRARDALLPFIFCTGFLGEERAIETLKSGATDYVLKDRLARLVPVIRRALHEHEQSNRRREIEEALRQSEERLAMAARAAGLGMFDLDIATGATLWTEQHLHLFGIAPANAPLTAFLPFHYREWTRRVVPEDLPQAREEVQRSIASRSTFDVEYRVKWPDSTVHWIATQGLVQHDTQDRPRRILGMSRDITDRKRADEERRVRQRIAEILVTSPEGEAYEMVLQMIVDATQSEYGILWILGEDGTAALSMMTPNLRARCETCASPDHGVLWDSLIAQKTIILFNEPVNLPHCNMPVDRAMGISVMSGGELIAHCVVADKHSDYTADDQRFLESLATYSGAVLQARRERDTQERKRAHAEEQLRQANAGLEQRVAERTAEAEQRAVQLRLLASEITQAEQRERRRLAHVLHDHHQQMLVAARMQVDIANRNLKDDALRDTLLQIGDLIDQSIAEARSLSVQLSPPVLNDRGLIGGLEWLARHYQERHQLKVSVEAGPDAEPGEQDTQFFLFQAARELLFNTVKHAAATSARLELSRVEHDRLRFVVADDGRGFDASALTDNVATSGSGLFSIRERLAVIGGCLEIHSEPGNGTQMVIELPLRQSSLRSQGGSAGSGDASNPQASHGQASPSHRIRVLLADDHAILRQGLAGLLQEHAEIDLVGEAKDGQEAIDLALRIQPDVVLMDVNMPIVSGIEATRRIVAALPNVRVIGLSMHDSNDLATAMCEAGAVAYVTKSEAAATLIETIRA